MRHEQQLAWAAGFLDGEAYVGLSRGVTKKTGVPFYQDIVDVAQRHRAPLDVLVSLFGGKVATRQKFGHPTYYWRIATQQARTCLLAVRPYLIVKAVQADLLLQYGDTLRGAQGHRVTPDVQAQRDAIYAALRALNGRRPRIHAERLSESAPVLTLKVSNG